MFTHITCSPEILNGKPHVIGTRLSIEFVLELGASGATKADMFRIYPQLTVEAIEEAIQYDMQFQNTADHVLTKNAELYKRLAQRLLEINMDTVVSVRPLENYLIEIQFADGLRKVINIQPFIGKGISAALKDESYFRQVTLEDGGGIAWDNGYDFCPNFLRDDVPAVNIVTV